jgi:hypothetical protein
MSETPQERWRDRLNERLACSHFCLKHSGPCGECELREDIRALLVARAEEESRRLQLEGMNESRLDLIHRLKRVVTERALEVEEQAVLTQREREIAKAAEAERDALRAAQKGCEEFALGMQARAERAEAALVEAEDLLLLAYQSGHREGWEPGLSDDEMMSRICDWLANRGLDPNLSAAAKTRLRAALRDTAPAHAAECAAASLAERRRAAAGTRPGGVSGAAREGSR